MTDDAAADDTTGHTRRRLVLLGAGALRAWIADVVTPRRRIAVTGASLLLGVATALAVLRLLSEPGEEEAPALGFLFGVLAAGTTATVALMVQLSRATRRNPDPDRQHPQWRDASLLERSVDARGRVTLAPGTADRVAVAARRSIAAAAIAMPALILYIPAALVSMLVLVAATEATVNLLSVAVLLPFAAASLVAATRSAGTMVLVRDAADAELASPTASEAGAPRPAPPHGTRLP